jgi:hypothetical protein
MKKIRLYLSSCEFPSTAIARVCLAVAKTNFEAAGQYRNRGNTTNVDLNLSPWAFLLLTVPQARRRCVLLQSP